MGLVEDRAEVMRAELKAMGEAKQTVEKVKLVALGLMRESVRPSNSIYVAGIIQDAAARIGVALGYDPDEIGWDAFIEKLEGK